MTKTNFRAKKDQLSLKNGNKDSKFVRCLLPGTVPTYRSKNEWIKRKFTWFAVELSWTWHWPPGPKADIHRLTPLIPKQKRYSRYVTGTISCTMGHSPYWDFFYQKQNWSYHIIQNVLVIRVKIMLYSSTLFSFFLLSIHIILWVHCCDIAL